MFIWCSIMYSIIGYTQPLLPLYRKAADDLAGTATLLQYACTDHEKLHRRNPLAFTRNINKSEKYLKEYIVIRQLPISCSPSPLARMTTGKVHWEVHSIQGQSSLSLYRLWSLHRHLFLPSIFLTYSGS